MLVPIVAGIGAGLYILLADKDTKKPEGEKPKTYDDGFSAGREAADKEFKARSAERRRIEKIAAKQAMLYSRVVPKAPVDDGGDE